MQGLPVAAEKAAPIQPRSMALKIDPAVLSAMQLSLRASPELSDSHVHKQDTKVSSEMHDKHMLSPC